MILVVGHLYFMFIHALIHMSIHTRALFLPLPVRLPVPCRPTVLMPLSRAHLVAGSHQISLKPVKDILA